MPQGGSRRSASRSPNHSWCRSAYRFRASRFRASSTAALCSPTAFWTPRRLRTRGHMSTGACRACRPLLSSTSQPAVGRRHPRSSWRRDEATVAHARHRGGVPDHRSHDARAQIIHHGAPRRRSSGPGPGEARAASVDRGGRHHGVPDAGRSAGRARPLATGHHGAHGQERPPDCRGGHAPVLLLDVLCLSTSSPFWIGRKTGLKSYRSVVFRGFPRTGVPRALRSWSEYTELVDMLTRTGSIPDGSKIWWDVRPNWSYPTLEFRICDVCTRVDEAVCIAAILQAVVAKLWKLRRENMTLRVYPADFIEENKWRAVRYGLDGRLIDFGKGVELPARDLVRELIEWFIGDVVDELGSRKEVEYAYRILEEGSSADRQLATYERTGDLKAVVDQLIAETADGL